jgi:hypothetical protein
MRNQLPGSSAHVSRLIPRHFPRLFLTGDCFTVGKQMLDYTETLKVGSRAPEFALGAANLEGVVTLSGFLRRGNLILEFLRGTW